MISALKLPLMEFPVSRDKTQGLPIVVRLTAEHFQEHCRLIWCRTDRMFAGLMAAQWLAAVGLALWITPLTWIGATSSIHLHVLAAIFLGGLIAAYPILLVYLQPGEALTRHVIAVSQMLFSGLFVDLTGGRIETHFHIFGSLAFLAFYRDYRVLITATVVSALDHFVRGVYWPHSARSRPTISAGSSIRAGCFSASASSPSCAGKVSGRCGTSRVAAPNWS
jgi:hypothetical protein